MRIYCLFELQVSVISVRILQCKKDLLHMFEKFLKATISLVIHTRHFLRTFINSAHETIQLPLGEYSWNFILEDFFENLSWKCRCY